MSVSSSGSNEVAGAGLLLGTSRLVIHSISFLVIGSRGIVIVVLGCLSGGNGGLLSFAVLVFLVVGVLLLT